eukprot:CAMPEP_0195281394 /NCGR_PEP_ID=MMETSP0707-20130614/723_1 /TAXON_ID=33640 /ORGANISM="Asterionellopsis glacialis, Strain CCMP134" /LENGTH=316 /DNA_ID=CAMNT_0040340275 /DNA_START=155 /DNA_END=1105 /DNA_ORIENTATION=-
MSDEEREEAVRDLYAAEEEIAENPKFIEYKLNELEDEIDKIDHKESYELAQFVNEEYMSDSHFRLMFLRADRFDAKRAAKRLVKYFDRKVELFGTEVAFHKLSFLDFSAEDRGDVEAGGIYLLPYPDEGGRKIIVTCRTHLQDMHQRKFNSVIRLLWIIVHEAVEDETVQKNGVVLLGLNGDQQRDRWPKDVSLGKAFWSDGKDALPVRVAGVHRFTPTYIGKVLNEHYLSFMGAKTRARLRLWSGPLEANWTNLEEYGITQDMIPVFLGGALDMTHHHWLQAHMEKAVSSVEHKYGSNQAIAARAFLKTINSHFR